MASGSIIIRTRGSLRDIFVRDSITSKTLWLSDRPAYFSPSLLTLLDGEDITMGFNPTGGTLQQSIQSLQSVCWELTVPQVIRMTWA